MLLVAYIKPSIIFLSQFTKLFPSSRFDTIDVWREAAFNIKARRAIPPPPELLIIMNNNQVTPAVAAADGLHLS